MTEHRVARPLIDDNLRTLAAALPAAQRSMHALARAGGRYALIDQVDAAAPAARRFILATQLAHVHSEAAEAFEELRDLDAATRPDPTHPFSKELGDVLLSLLDLAEYAGVDLGAAILAKLGHEETHVRPDREF